MRATRPSFPAVPTLLPAAPLAKLVLAQRLEWPWRAKVQARGEHAIKLAEALDDHAALLRAGDDAHVEDTGGGEGGRHEREI